MSGLDSRAVSGDVELVEVALAVAISGERADHDHRSLREGHVAELHILDHDPRGERGDRLEAEHLLHRLRRQLGPLGQETPLVRPRGEQPHRVRELRLGRVHPAHEHVEHEVHALDLGEPVALLLGGEQRRHEVVARVAAARGEHALAPHVELAHRLLDPLAVVHQAGRVELTLDPVGPLMQPRCVLQRSAHDGRDRQRRVGLGEVGHELAAAGIGHAGPELLEEARASPAASDRPTRGVKAGFTRLRRRL